MVPIFDTHYHIRKYHIFICLTLCLQDTDYYLRFGPSILGDFGSSSCNCGAIFLGVLRVIVGVEMVIGVFISVLARLLWPAIFSYPPF